MKKRQEDKLSMYYVVQKVCNDNNIIWSGFVAFVNAFGIFTDLIKKVKKAVETQQISTKGVSISKGLKKEEMVEMALKVKGAVIAYADDKGDEGLKGRVKFSKTKLLKARDTESIERCRVIYDEAMKLGTGSLDDYGVSAAELVSFNNLLDAEPDIVASPRTAISNRKGATDELPKLIKDIDAVLENKMDGLMEKYKKSEPDFYKLYFSAREIVDSGSKKKKETPPPTA